MLPQRTTQEDMPSKMSRELVPPVVGKVYVSCTMRETGEVDTAAGQGLELKLTIRQSTVSMGTSLSSADLEPFVVRERPRTRGVIHCLGFVTRTCLPGLQL